MEQILAFVTPCQPLTDKCKFSIRVFTSWISSGLVLGLILGLFSLGSKTTNPSGLFFNLLFAIPTAICIFGFIGLGVSSARGDSNYHAGWYWYFFPIVTYLVVGFWLTFAIIAFTLSLAGVNLPKPSGNVRKSRPRESQRERAADEWLKENSTQTVDQFVKENAEFKPKNRQEEAIYQEIVSNPEKTLEDVMAEMSEEEFEVFIEMLLRMLGFTFLS